MRQKHRVKAHKRKLPSGRTAFVHEHLRDGPPKRKKTSIAKPAKGVFAKFKRRRRKLFRIALARPLKASRIRAAAIAIRRERP